uniref:Formylglycine-generating enzyme, required for sulfatase activity, contains SUMF1/FGE domain n=1 Tax=Candidatus Kentrum sp. TUN TaxID=2126343 RepID=A0A450ZCL4_9GAMM|nr:MAG: Formylglycine-generating enzyme, required for sulfatase activity, contains SUMF1/FGE domain [Candidatus Kentron sp. TUN]VFK51541.1 MAG: Formylglycine-generating enzyme, required for sulfatase activity, contains SUMF1/FGE domain [Candidatus Kentron sp. TUN]VFK55983.1 MAG: Formylglycine-generating enzyme, required for sulfatase activity, contains SUMF1/FGE domain [Candidatus Kentron sp. TUN]
MNKKIFISYAHEDEVWRERIVKQFRVLPDIDIWDDRRISGGEKWFAKIEDALKSTKIAILLISADFLISEFIKKEEVPRLLERHEQEGLVIFPVIVRGCLWRRVPWLAEINARPRDGKPLLGMSEGQWESELAAIAEEISELLDETSESLEPEPVEVDSPKKEQPTFEEKTPDRPSPGGISESSVTIGQVTRSGETGRDNTAGGAGDSGTVSGYAQLELPTAGDKWTDPITGMEFVWVPKGCFRMGSNDGEADEKPVHEVCVDGFWLGKTQVTQSQWREVIGDNPSGFKGNDRRPVESIAWNDTRSFIKSLNRRSGYRYRLPTEAEWEYACRSGGKDEGYSGGDNPDRVAWYDENSGGETHPVAQKAPNGLGLYDMSGNVWEWVQDWYGDDYYANSPRNNPQGPSSGANRVIRGGSWYWSASFARAANRRRDGSGLRGNVLGFRCVRVHDPSR